MDKTGYGVIGRFTLNDGEQITGEIIDFSEEANELIIQPIFAAPSSTSVEPMTRAIAVGSVLSFDPESPSSLPWPHSDPCRTGSFFGLRFVLMTTLFLLSTLGSVILFALMRHRNFYWLQEASAISYTLAVTFLTFAAWGRHPLYRFTCPAVLSAFSRLLLRHAGFLLILFMLQSSALLLRPSLPVWWNMRDSKGTPFEITLLFTCFGLGFVEVHSNRSILERAHSDLVERVRS
jgi:hypothetical protein